MDEKKIDYMPLQGMCRPIRTTKEYEIARIICKATHNEVLTHCKITCDVDCINYGKAIKEAGYRKESDTAREILEMIDSIPTNEVNELNHLRLLKKAIAEKYGVDLGE